MEKNDIHLWITQPNHCHEPSLIKSYKSLLTEQELAKQQRYMFEKDRHSALITRAFIKDLLCKYMAGEAKQWRFSKGDKGKPELIAPPLPLRFNLSHSKDLIICAVTLDNDIGCDVEQIHRKSDVLAIADRYFSATEIESLFSLPKSEQRSRFFDYWTLKESYIKAWGQGLSIPLDDFSFEIGDSASQKVNNNIKLSFNAKRKDNPKNWQSWLFYPNDDHRIAMSIRHSTEDITLQAFKLRFFESIPLQDYKELPEMMLNAQ